LEPPRFDWPFLFSRSFHLTIELDGHPGELLGPVFPTLAFIFAAGHFFFTFSNTSQIVFCGEGALPPFGFAVRGQIASPGENLACHFFHPFWVGSPPFAVPRLDHGNIFDRRRSWPFCGPAF